MSLGFRPLAPLTLLSLLQLTIASAAAQAPGGASPPVSRGSFDTFSLNVPSHVPQLRAQARWHMRLSERHSSRPPTV